MRHFFIIATLICTAVYGKSELGSVKPGTRGSIKPSIKGYVKPGNRGSIKPSIKGYVKPGNRGSIKPSIKGSVKPGNRGSIKPSGHVEAQNLYAKTYGSGTVIRDWNPRSSNSHLAGGMLYEYGQLSVPQSGRYYIYTQLYYLNNKRILVVVNHEGVDKDVAMISPPSSPSGSQGQLYTGGVFELEQGDTIRLEVQAGGISARVWMQEFHTYFGAYMI